MRYIALAALILAAPSHAQDLACTITKLERKVEVQKNEGGWQPATIGMPLAPGDKVHTGYKAVATVKFPDGSTMEVKPMSLVLLQKLDDGDGKLKSRVWRRRTSTSRPPPPPPACAARSSTASPITRESAPSWRWARAASSPWTTASAA
jgi:hypothetical protein